ncbi:hypothetical protein KBD34_02470 [Patescibacteria group bacterium]|nr:hypothetical protein [Patescibacteria group bacterium]
MLILPWVLAGLVVLGLLLLHIPPSGVWQQSFVFDGTSPWLATFLPSDRVTRPGVQADGQMGQRIIAEPVYASARVPIVADRAELALEAKVVRQPLIELGASQDDLGSTEAKPVWSEVLEKGWRRVVKGDLAGYVREELPDERLWTASADRVLLWHASTTLPDLIDLPSIERKVEVSLRGSHDIYFLPTQGSNRFVLNIQDMNRQTTGGNSMSLRLILDDEVLWTDVVSLPARRTGAPSSIFEKKIQFTTLKPGTYRLALSADDDVFLRGISTNARHWVMGPRLYVGDQIGYATTTYPLHVWTNSQHLSLETRHREGLQTVHMGDASVAMEQTHSVYRLSRSKLDRGGARVVDAPQGDLLVFGDGFFAFEPDALFLPKPRRLTDQSDPIAEGIEVIQTSYLPPEELADGWLRLSADVTLIKDSDRLRWTLGLPGITTRQGWVDIRRAEVRYRRHSAESWKDWFRLGRRELAAAWHRL